MINGPLFGIGGSMRMATLSVLLLIALALIVLFAQTRTNAFRQNTLVSDNIVLANGEKYSTIQAADKALGANPGEISILQSSGMTIAGSLNIGALHTVKFVQGGTYLVTGTITLNQGACLVGEPGGEGDGASQPPVVLKMANGANLSPMIRYAGSQACILYLVLDGNKANNPKAGPLLLIDAGVRTNTSYSTIQSSKADGVDVISTGRNQAAAAEFDRVMFINNDLDGLYCSKTGDVWVANKTQFENSGLGGGAFTSSFTSVNTRGAKVYWASGPKWTSDPSIVGRDVSINNARYFVSSVTSATELALNSSAGTQNNVPVRMGHGVELSGCSGARFESSDFGGNQIDGIKIYGTRAASSVGTIITGNQFGENHEYDVEIQGWDSAGNGSGAYGEHVVDNYFIGGSTRKSPSIWSAIYVQDSQGNQIASNSFWPFAANVYKYGVEVHETVGSREGRDSIVANSFSGSFATGSFGSNTVTPNGFEGNKEAVKPYTLFSQPYLTNNDPFNSADSTGAVEPLFALGKDNVHFLYGHPTREEIDLRPNPNITRMQVLDSGVNILGVPLAAPSITVGANGVPLTRYARYSATESPSTVGANTCAAQTFDNITGIATGDILIGISKPSEQVGLSVGLGHVNGNNTATVNFCNVTSRPITPRAKETYQFVLVQ